MSKPLYICEAAHRCKFNDDGGCDHAKPHKRESTCGGVCSSKKHADLDSDNLYQVMCVCVPDITFIEEKEMKL